VPRRIRSCDGLILIEQSNKADFRWRFYNSDGGEAEMCETAADVPLVLPI